MDGQDEPPLPLQQRESGGRNTHRHVVHLVSDTNMHQCRAFSMKRQISERSLAVIIRTEIFLEDVVMAVNYGLFVVSI